MSMLGFSLQHLRSLLKAAWWSAVIMAVCLAIGFWFSLQAEKHDQDPVIGAYVAVNLILVSYTFVVVIMAVRRRSACSIAIGTLFLFPVLAVLWMMHQNQRIPYFVPWWWGTMTIVLWILRNIPKTP